MTLPPDVRSALETHLGHPAPGIPFDILSSHLSALPDGLARAIGHDIPARERTRIPAIRRRRHLHATSTPRPPFLSAEQGRLRWPLLWERLGGDPRAQDTTLQHEERQWAENEFMPGRERFVGRLGRMLAEEEEIREWQDAREARARERRLDMQGEEFDESESEDEDEDEGMDQDGGGGRGGAARADGPVPPTLPGLPGLPPGLTSSTGEADQAQVVAAFERQLLELFIDGLDTINYDDVDFTEPPADPIRERDEEDAWFDDEEPMSSNIASGSVNGSGRGGTAANGGGSAGSADGGASVNRRHVRANGIGPGRVEANGLSMSGNGATAANGNSGGSRFATQNGQGEYDY